MLVFDFKLKIRTRLTRLTETFFLIPSTETNYADQRLVVTRKVIGENGQPNEGHRR